jgi:hypothetical protein
MLRASYTATSWQAATHRNESAVNESGDVRRPTRLQKDRCLLLGLSASSGCVAWKQDSLVGIRGAEVEGTSTSLS